MDRWYISFVVISITGFVLSLIWGHPNFAAWFAFLGVVYSFLQGAQRPAA